jgi:hypothetical protein
MAEVDPKAKLEPFQALIGEWTIEMTHPTVEDTVVRGWATYEWLEGGRFLIQRAVNEHPDFPDSLSVIGVMEGEEDLSMQYFDSRGVHRLYAVGFDGRVLTLERDVPGFGQRGSAQLSDDGSTLAGVWQLNEDDQGYRDDLAFTYRRVPGREAAGNRRTEANRKAVRDAFEGWRDGTSQITDLFAAEMVWRIEGRAVASKEYRGKKQFVDQVLTPFAARFAASSKPFRPVAIRSVHADDDTVIVLWDGRGIANDGEPYENSHAWFMKMRDGKVIDGTAFYDSASFNDLWNRVTPD